MTELDDEIRLLRAEVALLQRTVRLLCEEFDRDIATMTARHAARAAAVTSGFIKATNKYAQTVTGNRRPHQSRV